MSVMVGLHTEATHGRAICQKTFADPLSSPPAGGYRVGFIKRRLLSGLKVEGSASCLVSSGKPAATVNRGEDTSTTDRSGIHSLAIRQQPPLDEADPAASRR